MNFEEACKIALNLRKGYQIISASEIDNGWLFSFCLKDSGEIPDESPLFVSKSDGTAYIYSFEEHFMEIINADPIALSEIRFS